MNSILNSCSSIYDIFYCNVVLSIKLVNFVSAVQDIIDRYSTCPWDKVSFFIQCVVSTFHYSFKNILYEMS